MKFAPRQAVIDSTRNSSSGAGLIAPGPADVMSPTTFGPAATNMAQRPLLLDAASWIGLEQDHQKHVDMLIAPHRRRAFEQRAHPVEDFLFSYYSFRPAQLRRWHPGAGTALLDAGDRANWPFHRTLVVPGRGRAVLADADGFLARRGKAVEFIRGLLGATAVAPPQFGCFGLHEWAMVFRTEDHRHLQWPLRLGQQGTDAVVEQHQIRCSHFDAFRFFTPAATGRNLLAPDLESRQRLEQPACLHANMDLYKWAFRLVPLISSALVLDCFRLAKSIREVDMRASPYDLSALGYAAIAIETPAGKAEYVADQRGFTEQGQLLRTRLCRELDQAIAGHDITQIDGTAQPPS